VKVPVLKINCSEIMAGSCEHDNEPLGSIKGGELLD
jgi:hypothetical protein